MKFYLFFSLLQFYNKACIPFYWINIANIMEAPLEEII